MYKYCVMTPGTTRNPSKSFGSLADISFNSYLLLLVFLFLMMGKEGSWILDERMWSFLLNFKDSMDRVSKSEKCSSEDRISLFPDEILTCILSLLPIEEAVKTSVLSKRWMNVWTNIDRLDFDISAMSTLASIAERERFCFSNDYVERYVRWVNKVLQSHKCPVLDEFRVCCNLYNYSKEEIDKWVRFAFSKKVRRLQLDLRERSSTFCEIPGDSSSSMFYRTPWDWSVFYTYPRFPSMFYTFPCEENVIVDFKSLRELNLARVNVCEEVLKFFLQNCEFLEQLVVYDSPRLTNLEVSGPSLALRHLEICFCSKIHSLIVCNVNLISLKITMPPSLVLKDVPNLVDVQILGNYVEDIIFGLSCFWSKLKVLTLILPPRGARKLEEIGELPHLSELKQLTIQFHQFDDESMLGLTSLIRASPNLENCIIKLIRRRPFTMSALKLRNHGVCQQLQNLKVVEIHGYCGCRSELELVKYFLKNAVSLEQLVIDCHICDRLGYFPPRNSPKSNREIGWERVAKTYAKQQHLHTFVPSGVELRIL